MAELQEGDHFFVQPIPSDEKTGLVNWLRGQWHLAVIFSDESRFYFFSDNVGVWVWRLNNQEFYITRLQPTDRHGGYSVTVWSAIWSDARSEIVEW